jgi:hypothetical protein
VRSGQAGWRLTWAEACVVGIDVPVDVSRGGGLFERLARFAQLSRRYVATRAVFHVVLV